MIGESAEPIKNISKPAINNQHNNPSQKGPEHGLTSPSPQPNHHDGACKPSIPEISGPPHPPSDPIPLSNTFAPLIKPKTTLSSSASSGPLFPPGFEECIPLDLKVAHQKRRLMKKSKKVKKRAKSQILNPSSTQPPPSSDPFSITSEDTVKLAMELGIKFYGPITELHNRIISILKKQKADWLANQSKDS